MTKAYIMVENENLDIIEGEEPSAHPIIETNDPGCYNPDGLCFGAYLPTADEDPGLYLEVIVPYEELIELMGRLEQKMYERDLLEDDPYEDMWGGFCTCVEDCY